MDTICGQAYACLLAKDIGVFFSRCNLYFIHIFLLREVQNQLKAIRGQAYV